MKTGTSSASLGEGMDILSRSPEEWRLRVRTVDDLWVLQRLIKPGMSMGMLGERRDQTTSGDEGGRAKQAERKKMWIQLLVQYTYTVSSNKHPLMSAFTTRTWWNCGTNLFSAHLTG